MGIVSRGALLLFVYTAILWIQVGTENLENPQFVSMLGIGSAFLFIGLGLFEDNP